MLPLIHQDQVKDVLQNKSDGMMVDSDKGPSPLNLQETTASVVF